MIIQAAINELIPPIETREQIIEYYQENFKSSWKSRLASDLEPITGYSKRSLMRRFETGRENSKLNARGREEYARLGDTLPPKLPKKVKGFKIKEGTVVYVIFSDNPPVKRTFKHDVNVTPTGAKAMMLGAPSGAADQIIVNLYFEQKWNAAQPKAVAGEPSDVILELR